MRETTVVGIFPHPDDESYSAGGTLALAARAGARVYVVSLTRGEAGVRRWNADRHPGSLAEIRTAELERSCERLGAEPPLWLDLQDGDVSAAGHKSSGLRETLLELEPDLVLTLGRDGVYGHPDHIAGTALVEHACSECFERQGRGALLEAAFPSDLFARMRRALRNQGRILAKTDAPAPQLGIPRRLADFIVDISGVRQQKIASVEAHQSQLPNGNAEELLGKKSLERLMNEEWFTFSGGTLSCALAVEPFAASHVRRTGSPHSQ